ncbi:MAG: beta-lactamase family protein [Gemmatimonadetes bacterium]|nr:beta-lactamase family protein [Gemmatimonadota bacterium]
MTNTARRARAILTGGLCLTALASASGVAQATRTAPAPIDALVPRFDSLMRRYMESAHIPGLAYGVVRNGTVEHIGVLGVQDVDVRRPVTATTLFRIASMSKAFTALAILKLRDDGKLSLDALAETYVPEMRGWKYPTTDSPRLRVRDLLSHVGGFVTDDPWGDRQTVLPEADFTRMLRDGVPFTRAPGIAHEYSNFGYALLGRIVTNVSGRPFKDYIEQNIMRPLGMTDTGYDITVSPADRRALGYRWENGAFLREPDMVHGAFGSMGGVQTTPVDYAKWIAYLLAGWPPRDGAELGPVRRASVRELSQGLNFPQRTRRPGSSTPVCWQAWTYGMGMRVAQDCDVGLTMAHGGGYPGYGSFLLLLPEHGVGLFAFANRTYAGPSGALWDIAMELHKAGWLTGRTIPVSAALAQAHRSAQAMYAARSVEGERSTLASNFLMDRSAANWTVEFTRLANLAGACRTEASVVATGLLSGTFSWPCERGTIEGLVLLAPTNPPTIQALRLNFVARQ